MHEERKKKNVVIYLDPKIMQEAKELGLNVSKICENALKMAIEQIKPIYGKKSPENSEKWCGRRDLNPGRWLGRPMS
jgi:hypothetical protein